VADGGSCGGGISNESTDVAGGVGSASRLSSPSLRYSDPANDPTNLASPAFPIVRVPNVDSTISSG
jgi:hypothetical protein